MPGTGDRRTEQERIDAEEEESVRPLLARANLLRMRRQWDDAITACTDALRRAPRSANAHALLGNIYESQGKHEDAIEWYVMASEIRPLNAADAAQLEHLLDVQRIRLRTDELSTTVPIDAKPVTEKTLEWFDRIFPPGRADGVTRLILAMSASIAIVIALCALLIYIFVSPKREETQADAIQGSAPDTLIASTPIVMTPSGAKAPAASPSGDNSAAATPSPSSAASHALAPDTSAADIRGKVAQALEDGGASISGLTLPPASSSMTLDLTLPSVRGESPEHLRERAVRIGGLAVRAAALSAPETLQRAVLRLGVDASNSQTINAASVVSAGRSSATVIFVGTAALRSFRDSNIAGLPTSDLLTRFETVQWFASLAPGAAGSSGAPPASPPSATPTALPAVPAAPVGAAGGTATGSPATSGLAPSPSPTP